MPPRTFRPPADTLFRQAGEKFEAALKIKSDSHEVLNNWATTLCAEAQEKAAPEAGTLLQAAKVKLERANSIVPGSGMYNLACAYALSGEHELCRGCLDRCRSFG